MTKRINITDKIMALHEQEMIEEISQRVQEELKSGLPDELEQRVIKLMAQAQENNTNSTKVVSINTQTNKTDVKTTRTYSPFLGEFELLAAAGKQSDNSLKWFEEIIEIAGYEIEINPRGIDTNKVLITVLKKQDNAQLLEPYADKEIEIVINKNGQTLLNANLYIFPKADVAKGDGLILIDSIASSDSDLEGKFTIDKVD